MKVQLCWKTKDTKEGRIKVSKIMTVKQARELYSKEIEPVAIKAYLRYFDGWNYILHKTLKREEK